jgi:NADPH:quinone reductase-like Zn-dependent oxidoreductase
MKAVVVKKYGGPEVAVVAEVPTPAVTKPHQVLVKIMASSVNSGDARLRRADPWFVRLVFGFTGPRKRILGAVFAGVVEAVGSSVTKYQVGDRVYGMSNSFMGGHAEFILIPDTTPMGILPERMSFNDAAALPFGGTTALHFLGGIDLSGKTVFINGSSGAVGLCFLQIAKSRGAIVTAVTSTQNLDLMKELGADMVIDYTTSDIIAALVEYDVAIDCVNKIPLSTIESFVKKGGVVVLLAGLIKEMWQSRKLKKATVRVGSAKVLSSQFDEISSLYTAGVLRPIIDQVFPLRDIESAYRLVDSGRKVGSVVLEMQT